MNRLLQWLVPMRRRFADLSASSVPPLPEACDPAGAFARADRAMQSWLLQGGAGWRIASCRVLQPAAPLDHPATDVFEFVLAGRTTQPRVPPRRVLARCLAPENATAVARKHVAVHAAATARGGLLSIPRPLHVDDAEAVLLQEPPRGRCLADHGDDELPNLVATLEQCGAALRELHELPSALLAGAADGADERPVSVAAHVAALMRPAPFAMAAQCAPLRRRVVQVMHDLMGAEAACGLVPPVPLHRGLHPRQVFVAAGQVQFDAWDCSGSGDAALDLTKLLMDVQGRWRTHAEPLQGALLRGWLAGGRGVSLARGDREQALATRLHLYRAFHALRRACKAYRIECAVLPGSELNQEPAVPLGAMGLRRISACLDAAELHLAACRRNLAVEGLGAVAS
jgi:aminoglycoside phosphotransferase (APT) family kinase protein